VLWIRGSGSVTKMSQIYPQHCKERWLAYRSRIPHIANPTATWPCDFLQDFSSAAPCLVSRSVVQLLYTPLQSLSSPSSSGYPSSSPTPTPALQLQDVLREACRSFIVPPALLPPPPRSPGQAPSPLHTLQVSSFFEYFSYYFVEIVEM
jgi:hypothetical protein